MAKKPNKILKVAISVPNESYILAEAYDNHLLLMKHVGALEERMKWEKKSPRYEFYWFTTGRLLTPLAREKLIKQALQEDCDYIIMMDNDMLYPIDTIESLLGDMLERPEIDILAPLAFMRQEPHLAVMYTVKEGYDAQRNSDYYINSFVKNYPKDRLVECDAVGFGAVCIKMDIVKRMQEPYCFSTTGSGEDIYFCVKARKEAKARIFMDTRIKLGHLGKNIVIDEEYVADYNKRKKVDLGAMPSRYLDNKK